MNSLQIFASVHAFFDRHFHSDRHFAYRGKYKTAAQSHWLSGKICWPQEVRGKDAHCKAEKRFAPE